MRSEDESSTLVPYKGPGCPAGTRGLFAKSRNPCKDQGARTTQQVSSFMYSSKHVHSVSRSPTAEPGQIAACQSFCNLTM